MSIEKFEIDLERFDFTTKVIENKIEVDYGSILFEIEIDEEENDFCIEPTSDIALNPLFIEDTEKKEVDDVNKKSGWFGWLGWNQLFIFLFKLY